ncbi:MAG TPA: sulfatase [Candidatus Limnocylindrales bacterium]|nr:sulfatase [Candidatus Limnocylindrales bacterium]
MQALRKIIAGAIGGFIGGALVGLVEAVVVALGGGAEEFGVFLFGAISYGLIGTAIGGGAGLGTVILPFLARDSAASAGFCAGTVAALLGLAVARFRIVRDVFAENLPIGSAQGIIVHVGLLIGAILVFWLVRRFVLRIARSGAPILASLLVGGVLVGVGAGATFLLNAVAIPSPPTPEAGTAQGANAILIIADTLRADHVGAYKLTGIKTPGMDRLASDGVLFEKAYTNSSWTRPSVATIMTSLYPSSHKVMYKTDLLPEGVTTVAEAMREAGYRTVGYVTNINVAPSFQFQQGFQEYYYLSPAFFFGATDSGSKLSFYSGIRLVRERFFSKQKWVQNYYQDAQTVNGGALPWLDRNSREPFFTVIHYMDPHDPYFEIPYNGNAIARVDTPHPDPSQRDRMMKLYADNIVYMDRFIANLIEALQASGVYDNTTIVLVADHGEEFYEHKGWWHGTTLYDTEMHVPLLVKLPKSAQAAVKPGTRIKTWAQLLDVAPTILAASGVSIPEAFQGRDLFSQTPVPQALFAEEDHEGNILHSVRTERWKLITANEGNPRGLAPVELYDIAADPGETRNVAADHPDVVAELRSTLDALKQMAAARAVAGESGAIDPAAKEKLRSLGYAE